MRGAPFKWLQRVKKFSEADWANIEAFDGKIISRSGFGKAKYEKSAEALGLSRIEQWLSMEDWTGYLVGWEGCMAEDSISFARAFDAVKIGERENNNGEVRKI